MHLSPSSLYLSERGDGVPRPASIPPWRRAARTAPPGRDLPSADLLSLFPSLSPSPSPSRCGQGNDGCRRRPRQLRAPSSSSFPLTTGPRRWPPASLAPGAASCLCSVCVHVLQLLQETLAACARGRGGPASTQPPAMVPFSTVDALTSDSSGGCQVVVPPATAWAMRIVMLFLLERMILGRIAFSVILRGLEQIITSPLPILLHGLPWTAVLIMLNPLPPYNRTLPLFRASDG